MKKIPLLITILLPFFLILTSGCYEDGLEEECECIEPEDYKKQFSEEFLYGNWERTDIIDGDTVETHLKFWIKEATDYIDDENDELEDNYVYYEKEKNANMSSYRESGTYKMYFTYGEGELLPEDLDCIRFMVEECSIDENINRDNAIKFQMIDLGESELILRLNLGEDDFREFTKN